MRELIGWLNPTGESFFNFAFSMLIQSSMLIVFLCVLDLLLRKKVKAVVRYMIWLLVLVKLLLPPSLSSPVSVAHWGGDLLPAGIRLQVETVPESAAQSDVDVMMPAIENIPNATMPAPEATRSATVPANETGALSSSSLPEPSLSWQSLVFLTWALVVSVMMVLLIQRVFFVRALILQSYEAPQALEDLLGQCCVQLRMSQPIRLRQTAISTSPSVCGLFGPTILLPDHIVETFDPQELKSVLLHELAHVKRADLWINLMQTLLQVLYFFHPLLWIANAITRRIREQAVDETVLAALGQEAEAYPGTLLSVSKLVFGRPALSLRLLGVVESKKALSLRVKHITSRPFPKNVRISFISLMGVLLTGALLLPMARAVSPAAKEDNASEESAYKATLRNGVGIEVVGVGRHSLIDERPDPQTWWRPNGQALNETPYARLGRISYVNGDTSYWEFVLRITGNDDITLITRNTHEVDDLWLDSQTPKQANNTPIEDLRVCLGEFAREEKAGDISFGLATGRWEKVEEWDIGDWTRDMDSSTFRSGNPILFSGPRDKRGGFAVTVSHAYTNEATRLTVIDKNGTTFQLQADDGGRGKGLQRKMYSSLDIKRADIDRFVFEKRPYQWVHFKNVSLEPGFATEVGIEIEPEEYIVLATKTSNDVEDIHPPEIDSSQGKAEEDKYAVTLPNGTRIHLVGLTKVTEHGLLTWRPNGPVTHIPGLLGAEVDQMGMLAVLKIAGEEVSFRGATRRGPDELECGKLYQSDSNVYQLLQLGYTEPHRYGTLILKDIESGPTQRIRIPMTIAELDDKSQVSRLAHDLGRVKVTGIDHRIVGDSRFEIILHFSERDKAPNGPYLAEDRRGNTHHATGMTSYSDCYVLHFDFQIRELKSLIVHQQDTARIVFKNLSLELGRISKVAIETAFEPVDG